MHGSSFLLHTGGGGGGGTARATYQPAASFGGNGGGAPAFTTLPPIFSARPAQSGSHTARTAATGGLGPLSSRSQHHRGASTQRLRTSTHLKAALPQFHKARDAGDPGGGGGGRLASSRGMLIASGNGSRIVAGRKIATNADMRGGQGSGAAGANSRGPQRHDEATIGSDGTVTFGPNLSLLMSSLAVRFDEHNDGDSDGRSNTGAGGPGERGKGSADGDRPTSPRGSHALAASRRRAEKKRREWSAMNELYAKAKGDKAAAAAAGAGAGGADAQRQQHWFMARFNYPIAYEPQQPQQPLAMQQQHQSPSAAANRRRGGGLSAGVSQSDLMQSGSSGALGPQLGSPTQSAHHAHLLHSARRGVGAEQQQQQTQTHAHAVSVEEEEEEEEAQDER